MGLAAGTSFGPFRVLEPLGRGGMASVYKAYEAGLDRYVALKVLPAEFLQDPQFEERFRREARVVAKLEHPNIIPIYNYGIEGSTPWMAMRLISGGTLSNLTKQGHRLGMEQALDILRGAAAGLDHAHAKGVIHRDVKPQNILLDDDRHVYLADFGIAKMVEGAPGLTMTGMITGTPQYMAPEQASGKPIDHRADIYALGIVAYEMLTGRVPFAADTPVGVLMKHISDPIPLPAPTQVPEPMMRGLLKALAKDPQERWPSAGTFVGSLEQAFAEQHTVVPTVPVEGGEETVLTPPRTTGMRRAVRPVTVTTAAAAAAASPPLTTAAAVSTGSRPAPRQAPPRTAVAAADAPPPRRRVGPLIAVVVGVLVLGFLGLAGAGWWVWRTLATPALEPSPAPTAVAQATPVPPAPFEEPKVRVEPPPTTPTQAAEAVPPAAAVTIPEPRPAPRAAGAPPTRRQGPRPTPTAVAASEPAAPPVAAPPVTEPPPAVEERHETRLPPGSLEFAFDRKIPLTDKFGPVLMRNVRFKRSKDQLEADFDMFCDKGKDQRLTLRLEVLDGSGTPVASLAGVMKVDEGEGNSGKLKQRVAPDALQGAHWFRLSGESAQN